MFPNQKNVHDKMIELLDVQLSLTNLGMKSTKIDRLEPEVPIAAFQHKPLPVCIKNEVIEIVDTTATSTAISPVKDNPEEERWPLNAKSEEESYLSSADQTVAIDYENLKNGAHRKSDQKKTQFKCNCCEFTSFTKTVIKKHQITHNNNKIKTYKCNDCSKSFNNKEKLSMHKKEHGEEMPYFCSICKRGFFQKDEKDQHEKSCKSSAHYNCQQCDFTCNSRKGLMSHEKTHLIHFCNHCNKKFTSGWNLLQHKQSILRRSVA